MKIRNHPFASRVFPGALVCDVQSRIALVKQSMDADWLEKVIKSKDTQKTVRAAAERRLRWVEKCCVTLLNDLQLRMAAGEA